MSVASLVYYSALYLNCITTHYTAVSNHFCNVSNHKLSVTLHYILYCTLYTHYTAHYCTAHYHCITLLPIWWPAWVTNIWLSEKQILWSKMIYHEGFVMVNHEIESKIMIWSYFMIGFHNASYAKVTAQKCTRVTKMIQKVSKPIWKWCFEMTLCTTLKCGVDEHYTLHCTLSNH